TLAGHDIAGGLRDGGSFFQGENAALAGAEDISGQRIVQRNDGIFADGADSAGQVAGLQAQRGNLGIVDQQAGVIQSEGAAQGSRDGVEQGLGGQAGDHGVVDF